MNNTSKKLRAFGQAALARAIGVSSMAVCKWCQKGFVPAARVLEVEKVTGISRTELNPVIYPPKEA